MERKTTEAGTSSVVRRHNAKGPKSCQVCKLSVPPRADHGGRDLDGAQELIARVEHQRPEVLPVQAAQLRRDQRHDLLGRFRELTGLPALLNTSFNENEPIVHTPAQAIDCFARTRMDALGVGSFWLEKPEA